MLYRFDEYLTACFSSIPQMFKTIYMRAQWNPRQNSPIFCSQSFFDLLSCVFLGYDQVRKFIPCNWHFAEHFAYGSITLSCDFIESNTDSWQAHPLPHNQAWLNLLHVSGEVCSLVVCSLVMSYYLLPKLKFCLIELKDILLKAECVLFFLCANSSWASYKIFFWLLQLFLSIIVAYQQLWQELEANSRGEHLRKCANAVWHAIWVIAYPVILSLNMFITY